MDTLLTERTLTELDHARLSRLLRAGGIGPRHTAGAALHAAMDSADLLPSRTIPPDVVTMSSRVELIETATGTRHVVTLCYPDDAAPAEGFVSVLFPLGSSLIGLRGGALATWATPAGVQVQAHVTAVLFQPEACGDFVL